MAKILRPYQQAAIDSLFSWFSTPNAGHPLVVAPVGSGKSLLIAEFIRRVHEMTPRVRIVCVTHSKELLTQNADELRGQYPECDFGFYCAGLGQKRLSNDVTFASIQSVHDKVESFNRAPQIILIDEVHLVSHNDETTYRKFIKSCIDLNEDCKVIGFTGTPFRADTGRLDEGEGALFDGIAYQIEMAFMVKEGFWAKPITPKTETVLEVDGVGTRNGDYIAGQLEKAVDIDEKTKACVAEIVAHGKDRKKWLIFAAGLTHCEHVRDAIRAHGISCEMVTGETPKEERDSILARYKAGEIHALTNVAVLCLDEKTEILTSRGWASIKDISYNDGVASWYMDGSITFDKPKNIVIRDREKSEKMVFVKGRNNNIRVTSNHRMVSKERYGSYSVNSAESLIGKNIFIPVSGVSSEFDIAPKQKIVSEKTKILRKRVLKCIYKKRYGLTDDQAYLLAKNETERKTSFIYKNPNELSLDECSLIGFWLGDGTKSVGRIAFCQSKKYSNIVKWFDDILSRIGINHARNVRIKRNNLSDDVIIWTLARGTGGIGQTVEKGYYYLEPYFDKDGTNLLWGLNERQFAALMHGFWMADGNHGNGFGNTNRGLSITGTQFNLYSLLQAIGACRGYRFTIKKQSKPKISDHSQQYRMSWKKQKECQLLRERLSLEHGFKNEKVWCVTSNSSYIITRRDGKVCIVGNTTGFNAPEIDLLAYMRPTRSPVLYVQTAGRGVRPVYADGFDLSTREGRLAAIEASIKKDVMILDFGNVISTLGPLDSVDIRKKEKREASEDFKPILKICPSCGAECAPAQRFCYSCSYQFPFAELDKKAARNATIMSSDITPETYTVWNVGYYIHQKRDEPEAPPTMRASYATDGGSFSEWIPFESPKEGGRKLAAKWHMERLPLFPVPKTVAEAVELPYPKPETITIRKEGKYNRIIEHHFHDSMEPIKPENYQFDGAEEVDLNDEVPF